MGFLEQYFIDPIVYGAGYNLVNTIVFALVLVFFLFVLIKLLKKMKIKADKKLWIDLLPFVFLGGVLRALQDVRAFSFLGDFQFIFVTPIIYFLIFFMAFGSLLLSKYSGHDETRNIGILLLTFFSAHVALNYVNVTGFLIAIIMALAIFASVYLFFKQIKSKLLSGINWMVPFAHILDSCSSVTAILIVGGFTEQHIVPSFIFSHISFWFFIPIKIIIALLAIYVIDSGVKSKHWRWMLKFSIFVLGAAPGTRNALTILLGTNL